MIFFKSLNRRLARNPAPTNAKRLPAITKLWKVGKEALLVKSNTITAIMTPNTDSCVRFIRNPFLLFNKLTLYRS